MSDYLSNLAIKSLGPSELIRPRLASLFEPPFAASRSVLTQDFGWGAPDMAETSGETRVEAVLPDQAIVRPAVEPPMKPQAPIADLHTPLNALGPHSQSAPPPDASRSEGAMSRPTSGALQPGSPQRSAPPIVVRPAAQSTRKPPDAHSHAPASVNAEGAINAVEVAPTREARHVHTPSENALHLAQRRAPSDELSPQSSVQRHSPRAFEPIIQRVVSERATLPEVRRQPAIAPVERTVAEAAIIVSPRRERTPPWSTGPTETTEPRPIIRVTIGRVEVRAVTPPESPAPRAVTTRPAPILSLADYLKQVNERRR